MRTRLLIVDHMALVRKTVAEGLKGSPLVEVEFGAAANPQLAARKISTNPPDVILLDAAPLAEADLRELRGEFAIPVVLFTGLADASALSHGTAAVLTKPATSLAEGTRAMLSEIEAAVVRAHHDDLLRWQRKRRAPAAVAASGSLAGSATSGQASHLSPRQRRVIAIGASTGGTEALAEILARLPRQTPGILIVQHMPSGFTRLFAERLDQLSEMDVKEAEDGDAVRDEGSAGAGRLADAAGVRRAGLEVRVEPGEKVSGHCPSVDVLMHSVAEQAGARAAGVLLTGMGSDGAEGMKALKLAGAVTLAQDEKSSVVFGMPREAYERGGVDRLVPLRDIPGQLLSALRM